VHRRRIVVPAAAFALALALAGCSWLPGHGSHAPAPVPAATVQDHYVCGGGVTLLTPSPTPPAPRPTPTPTPTPTLPAAGRMPSGFVPVAAVRCELGRPDRAGTVTAVRYTGALTALLRALAQPDARIPDHQACPAIAVIPPVLWLVDGTGRAVRVHYPTDECGLPKGDVDKALAKLTATPVAP
jgi:hypothetical protein